MIRSITALLATFVALSAPGAMSAESPAYKPIPLNHGAFSAAKEPYRSFIERLTNLEKSGQLKADTGSVEAKNWVLDHLAAEFSCARDFGGVCSGGSPLESLKSFLRQLSNMDWEEVRQLQSRDDLDINALSFDLSRAFFPINTRVNKRDGDVCFPAIAELRNQAEERVIVALFGGEEMILEALSRMWAVRTGYRVRASASIDAPIVGRIRNEIIRFHHPYSPMTKTDGQGQSRDWYEVTLPTGVRGFVAVKDEDRFAISSVAQSQLCLKAKDGRVTITQFISGGD